MKKRNQGLLQWEQASRYKGRLGELPITFEQVPKYDSMYTGYTLYYTVSNRIRLLCLLGHTYVMSAQKGVG